MGGSSIQNKVDDILKEFNEARIRRKFIFSRLSGTDNEALGSQ